MALIYWRYKHFFKNESFALYLDNAGCIAMLFASLESKISKYVDRDHNMKVHLKLNTCQHQNKSIKYINKGLVLEFVLNKLISNEVGVLSIHLIYVFKGRFVSWFWKLLFSLQLFCHSKIFFSNLICKKICFLKLWCLQFHQLLML